MTAPAQPALLGLYGRMRLLREFDSALEKLVADGRVHGLMHVGAGQEAAGIGAAAVLRPGDAVTATHRPHAQYVGLGLPLGPAAAEVLGRVDGTGRGRAGHMLLSDREHGLLGASGIVGHSLLLAVGHGFAQARTGRGAMTLCVTGDGAVNSGAFNEAMNMMALWRLPVVVVVENNQYGLSIRLDRHVHEPELHRRAAGYGIPGTAVDGNDVEAVLETTAQAAHRARTGGGPALVEARTYRVSPFSASDRGGYQDPDEARGFRDPLDVALERLREQGVGLDEIRTADAEAQQEVRRAIAFAEQSPWPDPGELDRIADYWAGVGPL